VSFNIALNGSLPFFGFSTCGNAKIESCGDVSFQDDSTAGSARIHTLEGRITEFADFADGGNAQLNTDAGGLVNFSGSAGPTGNKHLTAGSIAGAGIYELGANHLKVGSSGVPAIVSGLIDDDGSGGSLVKVGHGRLTLSHTDNTYSGGTTINQGTLDLAAVGATGTGNIGFKGVSKGNVTLKVENAALSGHVFATNNIGFFGRHDVLDLSGLHFQPGAFATFHHHHLKLHSGGRIDAFTLVSPRGTSFAVANDGHGGTRVTLDPPHAATVASEATHHSDGSVQHFGDYLWMG
jgi:autotransporter-associated beta strand protein